MPDEPGGAEILSLSHDFPPVPTPDWEAAIRKDLKGADFEKKLVWRTDEGIAVRPYYRSESFGRTGRPDRVYSGQLSLRAREWRSVDH